MVKLSILIPVYNAERNIGRLLDCIIGQMDDKMELFLIDDGSSDAGAEICSDYAAKYSDRMRFISRENRGVVFTRRELFRASAGEWIWIIDADDMIMKDSLKIIMDTIESGSSCDMIMFDYLYAAGENETVVHQLPAEDNRVFAREDKRLLYKELVSGYNLNSLWSKVFKRKCIDLDADYSEYEDVEKANDLLQVLPIITKANSVMYKRIPLYVYHYMTPNNISHVYRDSTYVSLKKVWKLQRDYMAKWGIWEEARQSYYLNTADRAIELLKRYVWSGQGEDAYCSLLEGMMNDGIFSEAILNCDCRKYGWKDRLFIEVNRMQWKRISHRMLLLQKKLREKGRRP